MDGLCYVIIFSLLSCASSSTFSRRRLSQAPSTDPSTFTPGGSPFFPPYSSSSSPSPPPPPPPVPLPPTAPTYATFPANISALVLPRSPKSQAASRTLLIPVISAVLAVATAIGLALFFYGQWQGKFRHFKDESKSVASDVTKSEQPPCPPLRNTTSNTLCVTASTSDVIYLGNVVTSGSCFVKPESPEICPLPPLPARSFLQHNSGTNPLTDDEEEEDDDFYSPLASIAGQESRVRRNNPYSNCSSSPSNSNSPQMSPPDTTSPPMSSTAPHWSTQNPQSSSPERRVRNNKRYGTSLRMFSLWNQNLGFPRISSASTSPERGMVRTPDAYARSSMYSSVSTTPDRFFRKVLESSPPRWNDFSRNVKSLFISSTSASPTKDFCINITESSRNLKSSWEIPELDTTEQSESAPVPPPPPQRPPPAMPEPPPLLPPSQSFMVQKSGKKLSFSELPHSCWEATTDRPKPKLKPLPWDKVRPNSCRKNTWDSLTFNSSNAKLKQRSLSCDLPMLNQENRVLDPIKCQNIAFLLTTLKLTTDDVRQGLLDGDYEALGVELLESLSRIAPSEEEEKKLKSYSDDSMNKLATSERFLKELLNVPFVFKRVDALLSVATFDSKVEHLKTSFGVIQAACDELRNSRMLLKLVEAVLERGKKSGNAHDFKLEALLELVDIKLLDGRTTFLHSVVQNIIESGDIKGLQAVGSLGSALVDVKKSAEMDYGGLRSEVLKLNQGVQKVSEVLLLSDENGCNEGEQLRKFRGSVTRFLETAVEEIKKIETKEGSVLSALKEITENFHGDSAKEEAQLLRIFATVRDFLSILDGVCKEMKVAREECSLA